MYALARTRDFRTLLTEAFPRGKIEPIRILLSTLHFPAGQLVLRSTAAVQSLFRCALLVVVLVCGCGYGAYCERVERTRRFLEYREHLDRYLVAEPWRGAEVSIRVPKQFREAAVSELETQSQPSRLLATLRGLEGRHAVWRADVAVEGESEPQPAYMAIASNYHLRTDGRVLDSDVTRFEHRFVHRLHQRLGRRPPSRSTWTEETLPEVAEFTPVRRFHRFAVDWTPPDAPERPFRVLLAVHSQGRAQTAIVFFLPAGIAASEGLNANGGVALCLETLTLE